MKGIIAILKQNYVIWYKDSLTRPELYSYIVKNKCRCKSKWDIHSKNDLPLCVHMWATAAATKPLHGFVNYQDGSCPSPHSCNYQNVQWGTFSQIEIKRWKILLKTPQTPLLWHGSTAGCLDPTLKSSGKESKKKKSWNEGRAVGRSENMKGD